MHQKGAKFINPSNLLTIEQNYTTFQGDLSAQNINVDNNLFVNNTSIFYNNVTFGNSNSVNIITFNSKLSNFTMHNGTQFSNIVGTLTITETNTFLDTDLTTNSITVNDDTTLNGDVILGSSCSNITTISSKLNDFIVKNGAEFTNTSGLLTFTETNTFLDTDLTSNSLIVNNDTTFKGTTTLDFITTLNNNVAFGVTNSSNLISFNSKLSSFAMHQGVEFTNIFGSLTIDETDTFLDTNLTTNDLTINNNLNINKNIILLGDATFCTNLSNIITLYSKLSNFTVHQGAQFINTSGSLTVTETNTFI